MFNAVKPIICGIYGLYDPNDGLIKYIGSSTNIYQRLYSHITNRNRYRNNYSKWLQNLFYNGQKPGLIILQECNKTDFADIETFYMSRYGSSILNKITVVYNYNKYGVYCKNLDTKEIKFFKTLDEIRENGFNHKAIGDIISRKRNSLDGCIFWMGNEKEPLVQKYKKPTKQWEYKNQYKTLREWSKILEVSCNKLYYYCFVKTMSVQEAVETLNKNKPYRQYFYCGKMYNLYELARMYNIKPDTLKSRIDTGWNMDAALKTPIRQLDKKSADR